MKKEKKNKYVFYGYLVITYIINSLRQKLVMAGDENISNFIPR
jgi:hypothetical protein